MPAPTTTPLAGARKKLINFLIENGWSVVKAGKMFNCAPAYVSMLKTGAATPGLRLAARIEAVTGISCSEWVPDAVDSAAS